MKKAVILLLALALAALGGCASRTLEVEVYRAVLPYYLSNGPPSAPKRCTWTPR